MAGLQSRDVAWWSTQSFFSIHQRDRHTDSHVAIAIAAIESVKVWQVRVDNKAGSFFDTKCIGTLVACVLQCMFCFYTDFGLSDVLLGRVDCHVTLFVRTARTVIDRTTHAWRLITWLSLPFLLLCCGCVGVCQRLFVLLNWVLFLLYTFSIKEIELCCFMGVLGSILWHRLHQIRTIATNDRVSDRLSVCMSHGFSQLQCV